MHISDSWTWIQRQEKKEEKQYEEEDEEQIWIAELKASDLVHLRCENISSL